MIALFNDSLHFDNFRTSTDDIAYDPFVVFNYPGYLHLNKSMYLKMIE